LLYFVPDLGVYGSYAYVIRKLSGDNVFVRLHRKDAQVITRITSIGRMI
jgi:hypothetical protein